MPPKPSRVWFPLVPGLLTVAAALLLQSFQKTDAATAEPPAATYSQGTLHVTIPYNAAHTGAGQLTVELVNPEDEVLARMERGVQVDVGKAHWQADVKLEKPLPIDDLTWHRLRYRFAYAESKDAAIGGVESVSQILRTPVIHIIGQQAYLAGGAAAARVVVTDSKNEPVAGTLRISLAQSGGKSQPLFTAQLNRRGSAQAQFRFPAGITGSYQLRYVADTLIGSAELTQQVRL